MSTGRYSKRGWAFQGYVFRPWALAGGAGGGVFTDRIRLIGTSLQRNAVCGTSVEISRLIGSSVEAIGIEGTPLERNRVIGTSTEATRLSGTLP